MTWGERVTAFLLFALIALAAWSAESVVDDWRRDQRAELCEAWTRAAAGWGVAWRTQAEAASRSPWIRDELGLEPDLQRRRWAAARDRADAACEGVDDG